MSSTIMVVPCYNEEQRLPTSEFREFSRAHPHVRFLLVNDGSKDGTQQVLEGLAAEDPKHFTAHALAQNSGKAEAVRQGLLMAMEQRPDFVGFWDADLATPLPAMEEFIATLEQNPDVDMVLGSRVQLLGRNIERDRGRHYFGRVAATAVSSMLGLRVYDTQCGAKLFRVSTTMRDVFTEPFLTRWVFDVEILARYILAHRDLPRQALEARVYEIPLRKWMDVKGSRLKPMDFVKAPMELVRIWRHYFG